jgi:hypothetical protein
MRIFFIGVLRYHNRADDRPERSLGPRLPDPAFQLGIVKLLRSLAVEHAKHDSV